MRKFTLLLTLAMGFIAAKAQTIATFESLTLPKLDTFHTDYSNPGTDVGFDDGLAHFESYYQSSSFGTYWDHGFSYSNMTDNVNGSYTNDHSSITGGGVLGSSQYNVFWGDSARIQINGKAKGQPVNGFYIANGTYPYYIMKDGDPFGFSKKMGGVSGNDSDWFSVKIYGYSNGIRTTDSVEAFLADFRDPSNNADTLYDTWRWVNLLPLGKVDSLVFYISSSDVGAFGINTPKYFCMDNFSTFETSDVKNVNGDQVAKVYPNPATDKLYIDLSDKKAEEIYVMDVSGKIVLKHTVTEKLTLLNTTSLQPGMYMLSIRSGENVATSRFVKQ